MMIHSKDSRPRTGLFGLAQSDWPKEFAVEILQFPSKAIGSTAILRARADTEKGQIRIDIIAKARFRGDHSSGELGDLDSVCVSGLNTRKNESLNGSHINRTVGGIMEAQRRAIIFELREVCVKCEKFQNSP